MQHDFLPQVSVKSRKHLPAFSDYTSQPSCSVGHDRCRKNAYFLPECVFGQKCVLFSRSLAILFPCLSDTAGSISDSRRNREDGTEGIHPHAFERISIPLSFPNPSGCQESPASEPHRCIEWWAPDAKRYSSDPAIQYDTRDPAKHLLLQKRSLVL